MGITEGIGLMEPMLPPDGERKLEDLAMNLAIRGSDHQAVKNAIWL